MILITPATKIITIPIHQFTPPETLDISASQKQFLKTILSSSFSSSLVVLVTS